MPIIAPLVALALVQGASLEVSVSTDRDVLLAETPTYSDMDGSRLTADRCELDASLADCEPFAVSGRGVAHVRRNSASMRAGVLTVRHRGRVAASIELEGARLIALGDGVLAYVAVPL